MSDAEHLHCCMKCPQILRGKTLYILFKVIAHRIKWKEPAEGKCPQIMMESTCRW